MYILYVDSKKHGYDRVKVKDDKMIYDGRTGTIPLKTDAEYIHVTMYNSVANESLKYKLLQYFHLFFSGLVAIGLGIEVIRPYYFKLTLHKQLFMQLQFDGVYSKLFTSNVLMKQEKIKDAQYRKLWLISYILPLQFIVFCIGGLMYLLVHSMLMLAMFGLLMLIVQVNIIYKCFVELK